MRTATVRRDRNTDAMQAIEASRNAKIVMEFNTLAAIVERLRPTFRSPEQQQLDAIANLWHDALGADIAERARPVRYERATLTIAVRQAIWAQQLASQAHPILERLRPHLPSGMTIANLRFRVAPHLFAEPDSAPADLARSQPAPHPSHWPCDRFTATLPTPPGLPEANIPKAHKPQARNNKDSDNRLDRLTQRWNQRLARADATPCPRCQCPTPPGELARWSMCAPCATTLFQPKMALGCQREPFQEPDRNADETSRP